ncbi:MAG TPA: hypothetical protein VMH83_01570 [Candidatus Acidoferrum sp.]|nr:hypothetical protein [Candidatus Acidoferrum sp.]
MNPSLPQAWIFEDSATLALQLERLLRELGCQVHRGDVAAPALPPQPPPALICVALLGPQLNGFKLLRRLAAHNCPKLLLTATGRGSDVGWGLQAGATAVLAWPPTREQLQRYCRGDQHR